MKNNDHTSSEIRISYLYELLKPINQFKQFVAWKKAKKPKEATQIQKMQKGRFLLPWYS